MDNRRTHSCNSQSEERVRNAVKKLAKLQKTATQGRLDGFFSVLPKSQDSTLGKRKARILTPSNTTAIRLTVTAIV